MDIKNFLRNMPADKKRAAIVTLGIVGIILIFLSDFIHTESRNTEEAVTSESEPLTVESYRKQLEEELTRIVSAIDGAGEVEILITMDSTVEDVYILEKNVSEKSAGSSDDTAHDSENEYKEENEYVIIKSKDGSEQTVLQKQVMPKIRGVLVVCDGGGNSVTREKITQAVASVLNISSGKVYVTY
ncbi:MAG: hypothetical protein II931_07130 [Clostridia bacterium]|nr:hypothetical protein [Clostridia bacterium]